MVWELGQSQVKVEMIKEYYDKPSEVYFHSSLEELFSGDELEKSMIKQISLKPIEVTHYFKDLPDDQQIRLTLKHYVNDRKPGFSVANLSFFSDVSTSLKLRSFSFYENQPFDETFSTKEYSFELNPFEDSVLNSFLDFGSESGARHPAMNSIEACLDVLRQKTVTYNNRVFGYLSNVS